MYMMNVLVLSIGLLLLIFVICDFFFTTLSGSGAGLISKPIASLSYRATRASSKMFGRKVFDYSGMIVNLGVLFVWILLVWFGLFLVYSYDVSAITNSNSRPANWVERLYFTGYVLSTLGLGNFKPTSPFFEIITSVFSFFGFIFFTSSMTYLISISSAVIRKRTLSRTIFNLGKSPAAMVSEIKKLDRTFTDQQSLRLQEEIDKHLVSHQAYPVVHFFSHKNPDNCFNLNFVRLDEALSILLDQKSSDESGSWGKEELQQLRSTMTHLLIHLKENFSASLPKSALTDIKRNEPIDYSDLTQRRKVLAAMLQSEGFSWKYVTEK